MKLKCVFLFTLSVLVNSAVGISIIFRDDQVFVDDELIDFSKLPVIEDTEHYTTYELKPGGSTITKGKFGNFVTVNRPLTEEEIKEMEEMQAKMNQELEQRFQEVQDNMAIMHQQLAGSINYMNQQFQKIFRGIFNFSQ